MTARTPTVGSPLCAGSRYSTDLFSDRKRDSAMLPLKPKKSGYSVDDIEDLGISMPYLDKDKGCEPLGSSTRVLHPLHVDPIVNNTPKLDILEKKRIEHERQRQEQRKLFEEHMKLLEVRQMKEEQDLICEQQRHWNQQHQHARDNGKPSSSYSAPTSSGSTTHNSPSDTRMRSNTVCVVERNRGINFSPPVESAKTPVLHAACSEKSPAMGPPLLSTPMDRSASKSLPASRRNSGDMSTIWQNLEDLGLDDTKGEGHLEKDDDVNRYRIRTQVESVYFQAGSSSSNKTVQQRLGRNITSDGTMGAFATNVRNQNNRPRFCTAEDEIKGCPNQPGGPSHVRSYLKMNNMDDRFPILVRRDSYPGMLSASSAALDLAPLPQMTMKTSSCSRNQKWLQESRDPSLSSAPNSTVISGLEPNSKSTRSIVNKLDSGVSIAAQHGASEIVAASAMPTKANANSPLSSNPANEMHNHGLYTLIQNPNRSYGYDGLASLPVYHDTATEPASQNVGVCKYFQQGSCTRGSRCTFSHVFQGDPLHNHHPVTGINSNMPSRLPIPQHAGPIHTAQISNSLGYQNNHIPTMGMNNVEFFGINETFPRSGMMAYLQRSVAHGNDNVTDSNMVRAHANNTVVTKHGQKRSTEVDNKANRFAGVRLEDMVGDFYALCKDQHGCRYLQRKLEEQNEQHLDIIFNEVFSHFSELMIDPFGNYLCQKILEYCTDQQRTLVVEAVSPELVGISLNMHGTRAVQKMIEYLSNTQQVHSITVAFSPNVVILIKDLNGNHVIQKCLNRLSSDDNQFIYDAVSQNCIDVATHRHGCCVLQRCIDHASESQKVQLVAEITYNALTLVQDPFGNYVVQYVLDLGDARFSDPIIRRFIGNVCLLSVQKFSSNVMEKCIRVAENETRWFLIDEMLNRERLDKLLRDSYANYVVQTALDYADPVQRAQLVDCILPLLPAIRNTPYGKRIQCKLQRDSGMHMAQPSPGMNISMLNGLNAHFGPTGFMATTMGPGYLYM